MLHNKDTCKLKSPCGINNVLIHSFIHVNVDYMKWSTLIDFPKAKIMKHREVVCGSSNTRTKKLLLTRAVLRLRTKTNKKSVETGINIVKSCKT